MKKNTLLNKTDLEIPSLMSDFSGVKEYVYDEYQFPAYNANTLMLDSIVLGDINTLICQYVFNKIISQIGSQVYITTWITNVGLLSYCSKVNSSNSNVMEKSYLCFTTLNNESKITRIQAYTVTAPSQFQKTEFALCCNEKTIIGEETNSQNGKIFILPSKSFFLEGMHKDVVVVDETINITDSKNSSFNTN